jgi:predicted ATPase/transcriptional regulator with XRE-family HTH domain
MEEVDSPLVFNEWLKRRRKALDMTQSELAQRVGCSVFAVRKIESGERRPSKQLAGLLATALEISHQDQETFIRVARGNLNVGRLRQPSSEPIASSPAAETLQAESIPPPDAGSKPVSPSSRIPLQTTPLIGREAELAAMEKLFIDPQCRLLTLTGMGGIGKTRLAVEFASRQLSAFPGGVFYIPLASVKSIEAVVLAIADALDFVFSGPNDPKEQLSNYVAFSIKQETLLVLDSLEHLLDQPSTKDHNSELVELVSIFLQHSPNLKILGTSRERLGLQGEWTYELHGLSVPPIDFSTGLEKYDAAVLFMKGAQRMKADFNLTVDQQPAVARICQLLEGIPLAIELAAAWIGMLSCQEIAQEIQSNMDFLTTTMRDIPERHRSIRATFDHSWKLLSDEERHVLCQISVFHGGFDRNAAKQITGASLPLLASLVTKSLLRRTESGRYDLHEVIRQYASYHLMDDQQDFDTYNRHCEFYLAFAEDREKSLKNTFQQEAVRQLTDEIDNIRAAWAWGINHKKYAQLGHAVRSLGWYFEVAGLYREGIEQLEPLAQVLKLRSQDNKWHRTLGMTLIHQALLYFRKGEFDQAQTLYRESIDLLRPIGDQALLADAFVYGGIILHLSGEYEWAKSMVEKGLACARAGNDPWLEAYAIYNLGYIESIMGRYAEGYEQMVAGLDMWRAIGDPHSIALGLNFLVPTLNQLGRYEEAKTFMRESIALCEQAKNRWGMGTAYRFLGLATIAAGQYSEAQVYLRKSLEIFGESIIGWDIARSLTYLGEAAMKSGDFTAARKDYQDALRISIEAKAIPIALDALSGLAHLQAQSGNTESALALCLYIMNHSASEEETRKLSEQLHADLEPSLSPEQVRAAKIKVQTGTVSLFMKDVLEMI